jgi:hypothetical protein
MPPVRPDSLDGMVYQLWYAVIGQDGDGLSARVRKIEDDVDRIQELIPSLMTRESCMEVDKGRNDMTERRKISTREMAMLIATFLGSLGAIGAVIVAIIIR